MLSQWRLLFETGFKPALISFNDNESERGQNTHSKGEQVKIPLLPNNVGKRNS